MRRRATEFRRPVRRQLSYWIWALLCLFSVVGFFLFVVHHNQSEVRVEHPVLDRSVKAAQVTGHGLNYSEEMSSATSFIRQLADQVSLAKAYLIIAKEHSNLQLAWELSAKIRSCQLLLSKALSREESISLEEAGPLIRDLSYLFSRAHDAHYDLATTMTTMKSHIQALEERANAATIQSTVFGQMVVEAVPKGHHCIIVKLTSDWLNNASLQELAAENRNSPRLVDNNLYHFCVFSENLLAVSVVVNSTISNADHPKQLVFHIITTGVNHGAMQAWFLSKDFKGCAIEVQTMEELSWLNLKFLDDLRFYIPEIYPQLEKVVFLDDDVVVQKDLTGLFSLDLHGHVNGAVETCLEPFHRYYNYLNFSNPAIGSRIDPQECGWAFGMNVFDLVKWKEVDATGKYRYWRGMNGDGTLWRVGTLPPGLLTFYGLTEPLDRRWHVLGLGYNAGLDSRLIESSAVVHYNGHMKPWLKVAIDRYRPRWERYVNRSHPYVRGCGIS